MATPTLDPSYSPAFPAILENATNPNGVRVSDLVVDGSIRGVSTEAIAIEAINTRLGAWQYSLDGGATWLAVRADLLNSAANRLALLLGPDAQIRLLPFGDLNGSLGDALAFRAWDSSVTPSASGTYVVATPGAGSFSAASDTAALMVTAVNDAPTFAPATGGGKTLGASSLILQPDGKLLMGGTSDSGGSSDFSLIRLDNDGKLDATFSGDGAVLVDVGGGDDAARSLVLQPDGKILLGGKSQSGDDSVYSLVRINADGSLDASFSGDGKAMIDPWDGFDRRCSLALQPDGKILQLGTCYSSGGQDFGLVRLNADGSFDTSFGAGGKLLIDFGGADWPEALAVQPDGKILLAGESSNGAGYDASVVRINADGSLDTGFGSGGKALIDVYADDWGQCLALQPDGKILLGGDNGQDFILIRLNADGSLDTTFDGDGKTRIAVGESADWGFCLALQADGRILLGGGSSTGSEMDFSLIRLTASGMLDTSFSGDGRVLIDAGGNDMAETLAVQPDGKILLAGETSLVRLNADGSLDTGFNGAAVDTLGGTIAYTEDAKAVALDRSVAVSDPELAALNGGLGNYAGATVTVERTGGASGEDLFSGIGGLLLSGASGAALLDGVALGSFTNNGGRLSLTFNGSATQARVDQALSSLAYACRSQSPPATVDLSWRFDDGNNGAQGSGGALRAAGTTTVAITAVNDAPTASNRVVTTDEDTPRVLSVADFGFADVDMGDSLKAVQITSGPTAGSLMLGNAAVTAGQSVSVADLVAGKLVFTPAANASGNAYASVGFKVSDGHVLSAAAYSLSINVAPVRDDLMLTGTGDDDILKGDLIDVGSHDQISGLAGNDSLEGMAGNDILKGGRGDDRLDGGAGADILAGGNGSDTYFVDSIGDVVIETSVTMHIGGDDLVNSYLGSYTLGANVENGRILNTGVASLTGNGLDNLLYAGSGNNVLNGAGGIDTAAYSDAGTGVSVSLAIVGAQATGGSGSDTLIGIENLIGSNGNDTLTGNALVNNLNGRAGDDIISGGAGSDILRGGAGEDVFRFDAALNGIANRDRILDFVVVEDSIQLENAVFTKLTATGVLAAANFRASASGSAADANDFILYDTDGGLLSYDGDASGPGQAVQIALLGTGLALSAADFVVT